jgi:hypothetical protein
MIEVGCRHEKTRSILIEKINNSNGVEVLVSRDVATNHVCYFCEKKIPNGENMFELLYRLVNSYGRVDEERYFSDEHCMERIREK